MTGWVCPDSELILPANAPRDDWLEARHSGLGGSDASTIAGVNPYSSLFELWLDKTGRAAEKDQTPEMRFGHLIEPIARQVFTEDHGIPVRRTGLHRSKQHPWMLVTPDGLTGDGGVFECKSVGWRQSGHWADGQVADHAETQVQWSMDVTGRRHAWVCALIEREFVFRRVDYDPELAATIRELAREFWHVNVLGDEEPPLVASDLDVVKRLHKRSRDGEVKASNTSWLTDLLAERAAAVAACKAADDELARIDAELIDYIGVSEAAGRFDDHGEPVIYVTRKTYERAGFDLATFRADHPDLAAQYATTTPYRALKVLAKPRKAR